jgi:DHA2 family multidrug resistance protein-like MFS transporter
MTVAEAPEASHREWNGLAVIALPCLLYSMELAVPKLSADLKPTSFQLLWIMDIYGFLLAGFLITVLLPNDKRRGTQGLCDAHRKRCATSRIG